MRPATTGTFGALVLATSTLAGCNRAPATPIAKAAYAGDAARVRQLLEDGSDPDDMTLTGLTPLMYAARAGHVMVVQELVRHGARPDLTDKAMTGWTALIHAIHKGQNAAALALLDGGAHPDVRIGHGATALGYAAAYGNTAIVRALLERGAVCRDLPSPTSQVPVTSR
jgi:ankyrin repeat protein